MICVFAVLWIINLNKHLSYLISSYFILLNIILNILLIYSLNSMIKTNDQIKCLQYSMTNHVFTLYFGNRLICIYFVINFRHLRVTDKIIYLKNEKQIMMLSRSIFFED